MANFNVEQETYNRCFVLGGKGCTRDDFFEAFSKFGEVKDVRIVTDRKTGEDKGVCYITYAKVSEAALAVEEMTGQTIGDNPKPLKVIIANSRKEGNVRNPKEEEKMIRLFIVVFKSMSEEDVRKKFEEFGDVEYVRVLKDRHTNQSRGLAYVKYHRAYHAALALENCDPSFKAVFAAAKPQNEGRRDGAEDFGAPRVRGQGDHHWAEGAERFGGYSNQRMEAMPQPGGRYNSQPMGDMYQAPNSTGPEDFSRSYRNDGDNRLEVMAAPSVTYDQLYRLFDIAPGLEHCDMESASGIAYVKYTTAQAAAYAKDKITGFEYPPGYRISVRYAQPAGYGTTSMDRSNTTEIQGELQNLVQSIQKATSLLQSAGITRGAVDGAAAMAAVAPTNGTGVAHVPYCNVPLPTAKPSADRSQPVAQRLFIVSQPHAISESILNDCFCRFGGLIGGYFMPGKNCGYVKFSNKESAQQAIATLNGQMLCGMRMKVMEAEPLVKAEGDLPQSSKRSRTS